MKPLNLVPKFLALILLIPIQLIIADDSPISEIDTTKESFKFYEPVVPPSFNRILSNNYTLNQIDSMLESSDYQNRLTAAVLLGRGQAADTAKCVELLVRTLEREINHPFSTEYSYEFGMTISEFLIGQYLYDFRLLLYTKGSYLIEPYLRESKGDLKTALILAAGLLGDKNVRDDVRNIYLESESGFTRFQASQVMNIFPDTLDIPVLKEALKDEYYTEDMYGNKSLLIQGTANGAMIKLGFTIEEIEKMRNDKE